MAEATDIRALVEDATLAARWQRLQAWVRRRFEREPTIEAILFLIGVQERGRGFEPDLGKEAKQALIMEGSYHAFEALGLYERVGMEEDGNWIWARVVAMPPDLSVEEQEKVLQAAILRYFDAALADA